MTSRYVGSRSATGTGVGRLSANGQCAAIAQAVVVGTAIWMQLPVTGGMVEARGAEVRSGEGFVQQAEWHVKTRDEVHSDLQAWLDTQQFSSEQRAAVEACWQRHEQNQLPTLESLASCLAVVRPDVAELAQAVRQPRQSWQVPAFACLDDNQLAPWIRQNLNLLYGRWLANHDYFEEAQERLQPLAAADVIDPPMLMFYRGVVAYRLVDKATCAAQLQPLVDHRDQVPRRYVAVAQLMLADIQPVKPDTLDEVARIMDRIRLRLNNARAGKLVRTEEEQVIAKLDKMIEKIEEQLQQQQQQSGGGAGTPGSNQPTQPAQQSIAGGPKGPGDVDPKATGTATDWGNLPPKEREAALQQLGKDVPSHYRDVIEEYFRTLAREQP